MMLKLNMLTPEEYAVQQELTMDEFIEAFGDDVARIYWIEFNDESGFLEGESGCLTGIRTVGAETYNVYGCGIEIEHVTFGEMMDIFVQEFEAYFGAIV